MAGCLDINKFVPSHTKEDIDLECYGHVELQRVNETKFYYNFTIFKGD